MFLKEREFTHHTCSPGGMGWHGVAWGGNIVGNYHPLAIGYQFFATPRKFFAFSCYWFIVVAQEKSPGIMVELNLGLCEILVRSIFSCAHIMATGLHTCGIPTRELILYQ